MSSNIGNSFGRTSLSYGGTKRVWREIRHRIPAGAIVSNVADFVSNGKGVIPSGSAVIYDPSNKTCKVVKADAYSTSATYAVGQYVTQSGKLYVCKTAIGTAESFTSSKWTEITALEGFTQDDVYVESWTESSNTVYSTATVTIVYGGELYAYMFDATTLAVLKKIAPAEIHFVY